MASEERPLQKLPPPMTTPTSTPASTASFTCRAAARTVGSSNPVFFSPASASPLSFSITLLFLSITSGFHILSYSSKVSNPRLPVYHNSLEIQACLARLAKTFRQARFPLIDPCDLSYHCHNAGLVGTDVKKWLCLRSIQRLSSRMPKTTGDFRQLKDLRVVPLMAAKSHTSAGAHFGTPSDDGVP